MGICAGVCCGKSREIDELERSSFSQLEMFTMKGKKCYARVVSIYDGDTCTIVYKLGNEYVKRAFRLAGLDCPELRPLRSSPHREKEILAALKVRDVIDRKLRNKVVEIVFEKEEKFGRLMGIMYTQRGLNINQWLLDIKMAVPYKGQRKCIWTEEMLDECIENCDKYNPHDKEKMYAVAL